MGGGAPRERGAVSSRVSGGECEPRREPCCQRRQAAQGSSTTPLPSSQASASLPLAEDRRPPKTPRLARTHGAGSPALR